jgi:drug/metabolite transporter (DMT)-like permease
MGEKRYRLANLFRGPFEPPFRLLDRIPEIYLCGQFSSPGHYSSYFCWNWKQGFSKGATGLNLILGIGLSVIGSGLIGYGDMALSKGALMGDGLAVLGAFAASGYFLVGRKMRKNQDLLAYIFPVYNTAGLILILLSLFFQKPFFGYSPATYLFFFLLAIVPQLIGHTTFNWALKYMPASMVAITILGEPIGSTILAYFILGEGLTFWKVLGGISILTGILIALKKGTSVPKRQI